MPKVYIVEQLHRGTWKRIHTARTNRAAYAARDAIYRMAREKGIERPTLRIAPVEPGSRRGMVRR